MLDVLFAIVIVAIVSVIIFFIYKEYTNSRSFRVRKSVKNFRKLKKEEEKTILKFKNVRYYVALAQNKNSKNLILYK